MDGASFEMQKTTAGKWWTERCTANRSPMMQQIIVPTSLPGKPGKILNFRSNGKFLHRVIAELYFGYQKSLNNPMPRDPNIRSSTMKDIPAICNLPNTPVQITTCTFLQRITPILPENGIQAGLSQKGTILNTG